MSSTDLVELAREFAAAHPQDAARLLARLPAEEASAFLDSCPPPVAAGAARFLTAQELAPTLVGLPPGRVAAILEHMPRDLVASALRRYGEAQRREILELLPAEMRRSLKAYLRYGEDSAGALMEPVVLTVLPELTAAEALESVQRNSRHLRYYVYVVDEGERLVGVVSLRELMIAAPNAKVGSVMAGEVHRISARATPEAILRHHGWRVVPILPVVDERNLLVGILQYETVQKLAHGGGRGAVAESPLASLGDLYWTGSQVVLSELVGLMRRRTP